MCLFGKLCLKNLLVPKEVTACSSGPGAVHVREGTFVIRPFPIICWPEKAPREHKLRHPFLHIRTHKGYYTGAFCSKIKLSLGLYVAPVGAAVLRQL